MENFLIKIKEFQKFRKNCRSFLEVFALIYPSQVSLKMRLFRGEVIEEERFHLKREQREKKKMEKKKGTKSIDIGWRKKINI